MENLALLDSSLFPMQAVATAAPSLTAVGDNRGNQVWSDFGSLARYEITVFEANIPSNTWKILGHHAQGNWEGLKTAIHAFRYIHTYWQYECSKSANLISRKLGAIPKVGMFNGIINPSDY